jgi:hypothetical protein
MMKLLAISAAIGLLGLVIHKIGMGRHVLVVGGMLLLVWQSVPYATARPSLLGTALLATVVAISYTDRRPLWLLPPLFLLWASVHGMFVVGLGYLFLDGLRRRSRRQVVAVAVSGLATAFTAHGLGAWGILVQFALNRGALELISEWGRPDFTSLFTLPFLLVIIGLVLAVIRRQLEWGQLWVAVPFLLFGLSADRNVWPAVIVLVPIVTGALTIGQRSRVESGEGSTAANWVIAAALVALAVVGMSRPADLAGERFPSAAAIEALDSGPVFSGSVVGGYLIYAEWPQRRVFIDDRAELYGEEGFRRFVELRKGIGVEDVFAELDIRQVIAKPDWPIVETLDHLGWETRYEDEDFIVIGSSE